MKGYILGTLLVFHSSFIFFYDGTLLGRYIQIVCIISLFLFLIYNKFSFYRKYKQINILVLLLGLSMMLSSYYSGGKYLASDIPLASPLIGTVLAFKFWSLVFFLELTSIRNYSSVFIKQFFYILSFYLFIADIDLLLHPGISEEYTMNAPFVNLMGGKFGLSYMHIFLLLLFCIKNGGVVRYNKVRLLLILVYTIFIVFYSQCYTAFTGVLFCVLFIAMPLIFYKPLSNPYFVIVSILFFSSLSFVLVTLIENPNIYYIVVDVFHKEPTLNGRTFIYINVIPMIFMKVPLLWGLGPTNSYKVISYLTDYPNTQNGLIELVIENGLIYVVLYLLIVFTLLRKYRHKFNLYPIMIYIYFLIIISCVEISLNGLLNYIVLLLLFDNNVKMYKQNKKSYVSKG